MKTTEKNVSFLSFKEEIGSKLPLNENVKFVVKSLFLLLLQCVPKTAGNNHK